MSVAEIGIMMPHSTDFVLSGASVGAVARLLFLGSATIDHSNPSAIAAQWRAIINAWGIDVRISVFVLS